jgi:alkylated DNA repair dioxygenase AlkB
MSGDVARVPGLVYVPDFVSVEEETGLLAAIDAAPWRADLKRRVQHYGYRYDYKSRTVDRSMYLGELPAWASALDARLQERGLVPRPSDQVIVNEYEPGQGISAHVDCEPCFDGVIVTISLGSACVMNFAHREEGTVVPVLLEARSVAIMTGESRSAWTHCIPGRKSDTFEGRTFQRARRLSLTFRKVILSEPVTAPSPPA